MLAQCLTVDYGGGEEKFIHLKKNSPWFIAAVGGPNCKRCSLPAVYVLEAIQDKLCRRQTAAHYALGDFVIFLFPSTSKKCFVVAIEVLFVFLLRISMVIAYFLSRCSSDAVVIFVEITATLLNWYCTHACFMTSKFFTSIVFFPVMFVVLNSPRCLCSQPSANHLEKSSQAEEIVRGDSAM